MLYSLRVPRLKTTQPAPEAVVVRGDLLLAVGGGQLLSQPIERDVLVIGRDPSCDFVIDHPSLSRRHAQLRLEGGAATVQDLGSTNGTRVAGQVRHGGAPVSLRDQASFQIGPFSFVMVSRRHVSQVSATGRHQLRVIDPDLRALPGVVREFARTDANLLIVGETGVGKDVLATSLHEASGRTGPLLTINCAALSESLLENELFGHERGAFTGAVARSAGLIESAAGGTLFLDEIGELPLATQAKLLRVVERREVLRLGGTRAITVDVRFVAATNRDLRAEVARRAFREDLFYRLDGVTLELPPLRERPGMIAPLALGFLARASGAPAARLASEVLTALEAYPWPGNVRELKAVIERAVVLARSGPIAVRHLGLAPTAPMRRVETTPPPLAVVPTPPRDPAVAEVPDLDDEDRARIVDALERCAGNQTRAAQMLGISRTTLVTKLRIYKIPRPTAGTR